MKFAPLGAAFIALAQTFSSSIHGATVLPLVVTGFNRDVVVENTAPTNLPYTAAQNFNAGEVTAFYQTNLAGKANGLPLNRFFTNATDGSVFQFQPYTGSNALVLSSDTGLTSGTLTLSSPAMYSRICIVANSGNGNALGAATLTLNFNDATSLTTTYYAPDWFNNNGTLYSIALQGMNRINLNTGSTDGAPTNPRFYQSTINVFALTGATNKPISSITFGKTGNSTGIYAVSGLPSSAVTLASVVNSPASNILSSSATIAGQVTSTGGESPFVTLFYGTNNGGSSAAAWSNSVAIGYTSGGFSTNISGLTPNRTYFYTARAVNVAGTAWATPAASFSTPIPSPASVTNLPASSITASTASLNGQVTSLGGDIPAVTIYYGPADGGTNAGAWAQSVSPGSQSGAFAQTIFGLAPGATYFFAAKAVNISGTSWAVPSRSFTTSVTQPGPVSVLTQHNDNSRSGDNLSEGNLNTGNVNTNSFGMLFTRAVDDQIYAQPLLVTNVTIPGKGTHNIVYVCTVNDSVYAFDADDASVAAPYWQNSYLGTSGITNIVPPINSDMNGSCNPYRDFSGNMGIVGTPVVDPITQTMWLVVRTKEITLLSTNFVQKLHAIDITTGAERPNSPVIISATFPGSTPDAVGGFISWNSQHNNQRPALTFANGLVYIGWSSHCDWGPYHGWIMAYDASTLVQVAVYCDTPSSGSNDSQGRGGIWMSGQGPAADASGNIFLITGNGSVGLTANRSDPTNRAMSFLKLNGANLSVMSWFTPYNWNTLNSADLDLGSGGLLLIPGTSLAVGGGKSSSAISSYLYVVNKDNMGGLSGSTTADTNIVQSFPVTPVGLGLNHIHGAPVWWDAADGSYTYVWGESDHLQQYKFDRVSGLFNLPHYAQSPTPAWVNGMTGGMLAVSANGTNAGTGILWASHQFTGDANQNVRPGILHAYDAQNVSREIWNSEQYPARDSVGSYAKFVPPTVANGKVYLATFSNRLNVYGLLPASAPLIYQQPKSTTRFTGDSLVLSVAPGGSQPLTFQWYHGASAIPGATAAQLQIPNVNFNDAGTYSVRLTNGLGFLISSNAIVTVLTAPTISYPQTVMADQPIAYWRLNETNGSVAVDSWGGHDGQFFNTTLGLPGYNTNDTDTAVGFGAISPTESYVGNITGIDFATFLPAAFSVEAWVNGSATQTSGAGIVTYGYGSGGEQFNIDTGGGSGRYRFSVRDANNVAHNASAAVGPNGTWQHVVGVCDEPGGLAHLYVNGIESANTAVSGGIQLGTSPLSIGARQAGINTTYTLNFVGSIDEVAIYNYALSAGQVLNHYQTGTNPVARLNLVQTGGGIQLTWSPGTLQSSTNVAGPYSDVPSAASPYPVSPTEKQKYFRVRVR